jgi:hypothetical protein
MSQGAYLYVVKCGDDSLYETPILKSSFETAAVRGLLRMRSIARFEG